MLWVRWVTSPTLTRFDFDNFLVWRRGIVGSTHHACLPATQIRPFSSSRSRGSCHHTERARRHSYSSVTMKETYNELIWANCTGSHSWVLGDRRTSIMNARLGIFLSPYGEWRGRLQSLGGRPEESSCRQEKELCLSTQGRLSFLLTEKLKRKGSILLQSDYTWRSNHEGKVWLDEN